MKRPLSEIKKKISKMGCSENIIDFISSQILIRDERIESQSKALEIANREPIEVSKRVLEVLCVKSSRSKITINPCTGRVTLKISHNAGPKAVSDMKNIAEIIKNDDSLPPVTMRGKISFINNKYIVNIMSESKRYFKMYEYI